MQLATAIFYNRAPLENLKIDFLNSGVNVLTAINGKGKTTILSHIADAFYELAREVFSNSFEGKENKYYRLSSSQQSLFSQKESFVYLRFKDGITNYDYVDYRKGAEGEESHYTDIIPFLDKIKLDEIKPYLHQSQCVKYWSKNLNDQKKRNIFGENILTYFPSYRFEYPAYLNTPYKQPDSFNEENRFTNQLPNPIENISSLKDLSHWIMDVVLDKEIYKGIQNIPAQQGQIDPIGFTPELMVWSNLNSILNNILIAAKGNNSSLRFGISRRNNGGQRIAIMREDTNGNTEKFCPHISLLSSGELALLCLFGEILKQGDRLKTNSLPSEMHGIVLIDEIEAKLHIHMQKEILPQLLAIFPNIQFIVSSHSPFLGMGLADNPSIKSQILDLENDGIAISPTSNKLYDEVYEMMLGNNKKYADLYFQLKKEIAKSQKPLIVTEGKTDTKHIRHAMKKLNKNIDVEFYNIENINWNDSNLWNMLTNLSRIPQQRKIIGIFDRDTDKNEWKDLLDTKFKQIGVENSNVFAFCIPLVNEQLYGSQISIEHYYPRENLLKPDNQGRRLFLGEEFYNSGNSKDSAYQTKISNIQHKTKVNGIVDEKVFLKDDLEQKTSVALSKNDFASLIENDDSFSREFNYSNFERIFDVIQEIVENGSSS